MRSLEVWFRLSTVQSHRMQRSMFKPCRADIGMRAKSPICRSSVVTSLISSVPAHSSMSLLLLTTKTGIFWTASLSITSSETKNYVTATFLRIELLSLLSISKWAPDVYVQTHWKLRQLRETVQDHTSRRQIWEPVNLRNICAKVNAALLVLQGPKNWGARNPTQSSPL